MKVVCPHTELLHPLTVGALAIWAPHAEFVELGRRTDAYWELLDGLWAAGDAFVVVEHDIEIHDQVLPEFEACPEPWCVFPYRGPGEVILDQSLGCTRFSAELLEREAGLFRSTADFSDGLSPKDWRRIDSILLGFLRQAGYVPHIHGPNVTHHHPY